MRRHFLFALLFFAGACSVFSEEGAFELKEVVITATKTAYLLEDVPVSTTIITREEIEELGAQNVGEALCGAAGVKIDCYGGTGATSNVSLRGSSAQQVLVLVDGRAVNLPSLGVADLSMYPVDNIERIEVVRGPASALYGASALGGVINIITREGKGESAGEASVSYGTFNTQIYRLSHGGKVSDIDYFVTGSRNTSDGDRENSECSGYNFTGKVNVDKLAVSFGWTAQDKGVPGSIAWPSPQACQDDEKRWVDTTYKFGSGRFNLTGKVFFANHWQEFKNPDISQDDISDNDQLGLELRQDFTLGESNHLVLGLNWEEDKVDVKDIGGPSRIGGKQSITTKAVYLQDEIKLAESLTVVLGCRYDNPSAYGDEISPRLSAIYHCADGTRLRAGLGKAFRPPTVNDLYWRDPYAEGNPDLQPEKSIGYDIGAERRFGSSFLGRITLFKNEVDNLITWDDPDGDWIWQPYNIGEASICGAEAEADIQFTSCISGDVCYTYLSARDKGDTYYDKHIRHKPSHKIGLGLRYKSNFGFAVRLGADYTGSVYSDRANTAELDDYLLLSTRLSQDIKNLGEVFIVGQNLLDEEYQLYEGYPMPGLSVTGGLKMMF